MPYGDGIRARMKDLKRNHWVDAQRYMAHLRSDVGIPSHRTRAWISAEVLHMAADAIDKDPGAEPSWWVHVFEDSHQGVKFRRVT